MLDAAAASEAAIEKVGLVHKVYVPEREGRFPLVLMVHGRTGNTGSMWTFSRAIPAERYVVLAPQAPFDDPHGGFTWWKVQAPDVTGALQTTTDEFRAGVLAAQDILLNFLERAREIYPIDDSKPIGLGFSQGGIILSSMSLRFPGIFSAIGMLSSLLPKIWVEEPGLRHVCVNDGSCELPWYFIAHGTHDQILAIEKARFAKEWLEKFGAKDIQYVEEPIGHKVGTKGMEALRKWMEMLSKKRQG